MLLNNRIYSVKCIFRQFCHCGNIVEYTDTNLDGIACYKPRCIALDSRFQSKRYEAQAAGRKCGELFISARAHQPYRVAVTFIHRLNAGGTLPGNGSTCMHTGHLVT